MQRLSEMVLATLFSMHTAIVISDFLIQGCDPNFGKKQIAVKAQVLLAKRMLAYRPHGFMWGKDGTKSQSDSQDLGLLKLDVKLYQKT